MSIHTKLNQSKMTICSIQHQMEMHNKIGPKKSYEPTRRKRLQNTRATMNYLNTVKFFESVT